MNEDKMPTWFKLLVTAIGLFYASELASWLWTMEEFLLENGF